MSLLVATSATASAGAPTKRQPPLPAALTGADVIGSETLVALGKRV